jgi:hypothetical protein
MFFIFIILSIPLLVLSVVSRLQDEKKYTGGLCDKRDFDDTYQKARRGYKHETTVRKMLNCYVNAGIFVEKNGDIPWLFATDQKIGKVYLDLDGYNEEANIAFEYQGPGHYQNIFGNRRKYLTQRINDRVKKDKLFQHDIPLIIVHYQIHESDLPNYVKSRLHDLGKLKQSYYKRVPDGKWVPNFVYQPLIKEPPISDEEIIKNVKTVERKGKESVIMYYKPVQKN